MVELAEMAGTTNQQISHLELGKRQLTVGWLERLAEALDCHPWAILSAAAPATSDEAELLARFRSLSPHQKDRLLAGLRPVSKPMPAKLQRS